MFITKNPKLQAAAISICGALFLAIIKLIVALLSGSMAVMASAIDSLLDILMSGVNFMAIRQAEQPPDQSHPFGHGKFETLATLFQAMIITGSGIWIIYVAAIRLSQNNQLERIDQGIGVLAFSAIVSWLIARNLSRVAKQTDSPALEADSLHFRMDIYTNLGLMVGLVMVRWFDIHWLDSALSILVAAYILREALQLIKRSLTDILDHELPAEIQQQVDQLIRTHEGPLAGYHGLRTRRSGSNKIMDFHLEVCKDMTVAEAHELTDSLEKRIEKEIPGSNVIIHVEPCNIEECPGRENCEIFTHRVPDRFQNPED